MTEIKEGRGHNPAISSWIFNPGGLLSLGYLKGCLGIKQHQLKILLPGSDGVQLTALVCRPDPFVLWRNPALGISPEGADPTRSFQEVGEGMTSAVSPASGPTEAESYAMTSLSLKFLCIV